MTTSERTRTVVKTALRYIARTPACGHARILELRSDPTMIICICRDCAHRWVSVPLNP